MARLKVFSGKEICSILSSQGYQEVRRKGSHIAMQKKSADSTNTVIVPDHDEVKTGTLMSIIRQSELSKTLFE